MSTHEDVRNTPSLLELQRLARAYTAARKRGCDVGDPEAHFAEAALKAMPKVKALLRAAEHVLAGLNARIDAAPGSAKPVFNGIAELHDAIGKPGGRQ